MAVVKRYNLARMVTATTGTGTITLGAAAAGYLSFASAGIQNGDTVSYGIENGNNHEVGRGVYTTSGTTLTRSVIASTNSNNAISLSGAAVVYITPLAEDIPTPLNNRIINGGMRYNQRAPATNADDTYAFDRFNILTQTGTVAVTKVTNVEDGWPFAMRITQSQATAQRFGVNQLIESINCIDLRGKSVRASARVKCSASTNIRISLLGWTGTADVITSDSINDWTLTTYTPGNFFIATTTTVVGTATFAATAATSLDIAVSGTVSSSMNNLILLVTTDSTQAQNVTLDVGQVDLREGGANSIWPFEVLDANEDLVRCQRYYRKSMRIATAPADGVAYNLDCVLTVGAAGAAVALYTSFIPFGVSMRAAPTMTYYRSDLGATAGKWQYFSVSWTDSTATATITAGENGFQASLTGTYTVGSGYTLAGGYTAEAEL